MTKVIVTGAAGYIGGSICIELKKKGYYVIGIDLRQLPEHLEQYIDTYEQCCFTDPSSLLHVKNKPKAIIHCAGTSLVGPSVKDPDPYYENNVANTIKYLQYIKLFSKDTKFIFSSSASVYGDPGDKIITEEHSYNPISPYGQSKMMVEIILDSYQKAYGLNYVSFRYFNACGAVLEGVHGQEPKATHIFARIFESIEGKFPFTIYGNGYLTEDGTCIRDYVHVTDIAEAHILAIENSIQGIYNIGSNKGFSNLEILNAVRYWHKHIASIELQYLDRREGDPAFLVASSEKLYNDTSWKPKKSIQNIIKDLHDWYSSDNYAKRP